MKKIYHTYTSSNSYHESSWTDEDYFECETIEEYESIIKEKEDKVAEYVSSGRAEKYGAWRFKLSNEGKIHASEYYYGHEWQGKTFDAIGVCYEEHLERSNHYFYYLKPGSVGKIKECTDRGCGWMYGS